MIPGATVSDMARTADPWADETLEEAQARADALFNSIGIGAIATDENGKIYKINSIALNILGYKRSDVLKKWFPRVIKAIDKEGKEVPVMNRPITQAFFAGKPISAKTRYKTKNGGLVPVSVNVSPILLNGKPIGAVEVFYDSTLEDEVDRMKSEFISIASHQLRTPLAAINTYANMLMGEYEGKLNQSQQTQMNIILSSVERMNKLISTLLDISQLETGTLKLRFKETNVSNLVKTIAKEMKQFARAKNINFKVECPAHDIITSCDPLFLGEIYTNLISNSIKYTPEQGSIDIKLRREKDEIIFCVKDDGYGIPQASQPQLFTKFFRASNIQKKETGGTGLGLYMVKQIADVMHGRLWFKSEEGKGSTFWFALPYKPVS